MKICILLLLFSITTWAFVTKPKNENRILIQNHYWAKAGKIKEVYEHRIYACEVRKKLGLPSGRVLLRKESTGTLSHVIWECEYQSEEARQEDIRKLDESGAFEDVMKKMGTLIDRFERGTFMIETIE